jgi:hypothetical protein
VQQELREEQQLRKEEGQQLLVQLRRKADEVVEQQKDMDSVMHGPQDRGRRRAWPALAEQRVLQRNSKQGGEQGAPAYWRRQLEERRVEVEQGQVQLTAAQKRIRELEGQLRLVPKAMLKRTAMPLINAKAAHSRAYKNLSYGLETRQHFIELASLNIPAPQLEEAYRRFYMQHWPHLKESEDWEVPCKDYITESAEMVGYQAEACAAHEYGEAEQMCMGMDGSTKDNLFHLTNCNGRLRKYDGTTVDRLMRGPTIAPKGGGSGDAVSQKDFCEEGFKEGGDRLDEWREQCDEMGVVNHGVPEAEEVTIEKAVATINDGEATAKAAAREVLVAALKKEVGEQEWDRMSKAEQEAMLKQNKAQLACHDHIRALMPKWGMKGEVTELGEMIGTAIEDLAKVLRIDGKVSSFNYACQKELKDGAEAVHYSQAKAFWAFMREVHPGVPALDTGRGKCGSRFDAEVEIAFTMYYLRPFIIEFVAKRIVGALDSSGGKLMEGAIFAHGTILEIVAAQRARAVVYDKLIEPLRWLQGKDSGLKQLDMGPLYDLYMQYGKRMEVDASFLMCDGLLPELLTKYPQLEQHERERAGRTQRPADRSRKDANGRCEKVKYVALVQAELYHPTCPVNKGTDGLTLTFLCKAWGPGFQGCLEKNAGDYLSDGKKGAGKYSKAELDKDPAHEQALRALTDWYPLSAKVLCERPFAIYTTRSKTRGGTSCAHLSLPD